jgi:hypothetical protein
LRVNAFLATTQFCKFTFIKQLLDFILDCHCIFF